jgi:DNA-binding CsgD family transcriptional regulator/tetratricopeptide (TPR) repeat protein
VWAQEEFLSDNITEAIAVLKLALSHYANSADHPGQSRVLARLSHFYENDGDRKTAEELAAKAVEVLGDDPDGADLAFALEANAYLHWMAGNWAEVPPIVERTLKAGGPDIDEHVRVRSLSHVGMTAHIANYPSGRPQLEEARERASRVGDWYEEVRALMNDAWAASEFRDLDVAADYVQRAISSAARHEVPNLEKYSMAVYAKVLEMKGKWAEAEDLARELLDAGAITQMVALPVLGIIEARKGRDTAGIAIGQAWRLASVAAEDQRLTPAAAAAAEHSWITGTRDVAFPELREVMTNSLDRGFQWSPGVIAFWLWKLDALEQIPEGIAEPYRLVMERRPIEAAVIFESKGLPYDRSLALMHGDDDARVEALEVFETLGATAVAAKLRQTLRNEGVSVPRGKGHHTRDHVAGLTARQAEILELLNDGLTNIEIADRLFLSPRTVENHVAAVLSKLDASTRDEVVLVAREMGILPAAV